MATTKINMTILSALFACAILIGSINAVAVNAQEYDEDYPHDHESTDEGDAIEACGDEDSCIDCVEERAELSDDLKNYEVDNCLNDEY